MSFNDDEQLITHEVTKEHDPDSLLEQLAAKRQEVAATKETFIPVPGYDDKPPLLLVRYRLVDGPELQFIGDKIRRETRDQWQRQVFAAVDTFILACTGIFIDKGDNTTPVQMSFNGEPVTGFTEELAKALRYYDELPSPATARSVVFGLFAGNEIAINQHMFLLNRWSTNTTVDVREASFSGNF